MPQAILNEQIADLLTKAERRLFRVDYKAEVADEVRLTLWARYNWIDGVAQAVCIAGFIIGVLSPGWLSRGHFTFWDVAVQFGIAVFLPCLWCLALTASRSKRALQEFLIFYSLKYGIHWRGLFCFVYLPFIVFGILAAVIVYGVR
jgi:hypothetical protein